MIGLVGVSTNSMRVAGVIACSTSSRFAVSTYEKVIADARQHLVEEAERAAVGVLRDDDVVAGLEHRADRGDRRHAGREGEPGLAALDRRDVLLEREARRILRARVLVALVHAQLVLDVGGCLIDGRDDRAGRRIRLLAGVEADGAEPRVARQLHDPGTITSSVNIAKPAAWPNHFCARSRPRDHRRASPSSCVVSLLRLAGGGVPALLDVDRLDRRHRDRGRRGVLSHSAVPARQATAAVARPPQADPLVHLHRGRPGDPDRGVLPARRAAAVLQLQLVPGADGDRVAQRSGAVPLGDARRSRLQRDGGRDIAEHR